MSIPYMIYQAERTRTPAEQRAEDQLRGELAVALMRPWRRSRRRGGRQEGTQGPCREIGTCGGMATVGTRCG
jgi:hypothetical protein